MMRIEVLLDADAVAHAAAALIANDARVVVAAHGRFAMAVSGGHRPWVMLRMLAEEEVPWALCRYFRSTNVWPRKAMPTAI